MSCAVILRLRTSFPNLKFSLNVRVGVALDCCGSFPFSVRCFFIAQSYVLVKKWSEALVLYDRVLKYANEVTSDAGAFKNSLKVSRGSLLVSRGQGASTGAAASQAGPAGPAMGCGVSLSAESCRLWNS